MTENKLYIIFSNLTGVEKRECNTYLSSPYFNQREDVVHLWNALLRQKNEIDSAERIYQTVYPDTPYDDHQWRYLQSFLLQQIENFLALRAYEQAPLLADLHLIGVYQQKKLKKPLAYSLQRAQKHLAQGLPDLHSYYYQYRIEWEKYVATETTVRSKATNLEAVNTALDIYWMGSKLRLACLMESHRAVFNVDYDPPLLVPLLAYLEEHIDQLVPAIALYYYCFKALKQGMEADFRAFRRELERQDRELPVAEQRTFLLLAINFCIKRMNSGERTYMREAFDLYRIGLATNVLLENSFISRFAYKNIVALGLRLEEFEIVEAFITEYAPFLEQQYREANYNYNLARLYYTQKNYRLAMPLLAQVDESDLLLNLDSRIMLLKMYYETGAWDALDALLSSFKILLTRKKKTIGYHQINYLQTLRFVQKLTQLNLRDKRKVAEFKAEVTNSTLLIEKEWLLSVLG